jgi:hypothetical protein
MSEMLQRFRQHQPRIGIVINNQNFHCSLLSRSEAVTGASSRSGIIRAGQD